MSKRLTVHGLNSQIVNRSESRKKTYEKIMENIYTRMEKATSMNQLNCFYEVPEFLIGHPLYNINDCLEYNITQLMKSGFLVKYYFPRILYISWNMEEIKYLQVVDKLQKEKNEPKKIEHIASNANDAKNFVNSITNCKPKSGKFVLNLT